jgi:chromate reductase, NAD(P)H dehydrogenase (quinone)
MIQILVGTDRPQSKSALIAKNIAPLYNKNGFNSEIINLENLNLSSLNGSHYGQAKPPLVQQAIDNLMLADGLVVVCPEYNGSMPGILKLYIDHWKYPESFEHRPVCFIGLGGRFGGLRPVEHLQQIFGYRNGYIFPDRVFIHNVWTIFEGEKIKDEHVQNQLEQQAQGFCRFINALKSENLHAGTYKK